jgi:hypothetical protein
VKFGPKALRPIFERLLLLSSEQTIPVHKHPSSRENRLWEKDLQHMPRDRLPFQGSVMNRVLQKFTVSLIDAGYRGCMK